MMTNYFWKTLGLCIWVMTLVCSGALQAQSTQADGRNLVVQKVSSNAAASNQRIALVIGNAAYKEAPLANPVNDARAIAQALRETGFTVILRENADQRSMTGALREFGDKLRAGGTGLFYFAGHGMQIKGRNFLIPVGANVEREDEVAYSAFDAQAVLDKMEAAGNGANIMILDACRNNPFTRSMRSGQAGLAQMDAPVGTLVAFATSPGAVASDGAGTNGLYTQHLLEAMRKDNSKLEDVFKQVRANVRRDSQGKQVPWEATSLEGDFYFRGGPARPQIAASVDTEQALWDAVKASSEPLELRVYLNRYPQGRFAALAQQRLASLRPVAVATAPSVSAVPANTPNAPVNDSVDALQDVLDRRTQQLLNEIGSTTIPANQATPVFAPTRPQAASNPAGFTVGDLWRYQVVDKFKGEVVGNYSQRIEAFLPNNEIRLQGGTAILSSKGEIKYLKNNERERFFKNYVTVPEKLEAGFRQTTEYEIESKFLGGDRRFTETSKQTMVVRGQEMIKTPAGEFQAWKIERDVFWQTTEGSGGTFRAIGWYVPSLLRYVAWEEESRNRNGSFNRRERHELTSYSVRGADEALAKR